VWSVPENAFKYNTFVSYSQRDKSVVQNLARRLADEAKLAVWLDEWNLIPGFPIQEQLEEGMDASQTVVVFVGPSGIGPWENLEMRAALQTAVRDRKRRVIPVLLPHAPETELPAFLALFAWVDLRSEPDDGFHRLVSGIQGKAPGRRASARDPDPPTAPAAPAEKLRVFLCHADADKPAVRRIYHRLRADGADPWLDEVNILPGQHRRNEIDRAVREAHAIIVCLSQNTDKPGPFQRELRRALDVAENQPPNAIFILPVQLQDSTIPTRLLDWEPVDFGDEQGYDRLLLALQARANALGLAL
jgi:hypothetical protein